MDNRVTLEILIKYAGGQTRIELVRFQPGAVPHGYILQEEPDASLGRTLVRDQVKLLNALRDLAKPKWLKLLHDADSSARDLFGPAIALMEAPAAGVAQGAAA
ncbi:MAG: hypothetical protein J0I54_17870 [Bosea sp.]|uniref:hypothetical protein n=1 Tax=unclassified Bosea (in: a-proteobacteria) TaxID=2653178 RepID=UPI0009624FE6|nr:MULTISPECIES: hypothetical protein [unclassified Bosea (in: a-proteobacteria)]MBN9458502.1 hypothetical protein [Bosea sp. (in: a-proteobacteria)]OJV06797.1 MAG: hypothetical protein BGO20_00080 [Bosea sp. 67-29]